MKIIVCGAGAVGTSIAQYLSKENNDVMLVDNDARRISDASLELDVRGIVGHASTPETLKQAGAATADAIVAVTDSDETNMVACQVAHSLFDLPKKIARIREPSYLDPAWANLFSREHMPIDVLISPEYETAKALVQRLSVPGTTNVIPLVGNKIYAVGVMCEEDCPILNTQIAQFTRTFPDLHMKILARTRNGKSKIVTPDSQFLAGDEAFFIVEADYLRRALSIFGHEEGEAEKIIVMGGGRVSYQAIKLLQLMDRGLNIQVIERNPKRAEFLSENLDNVIVLNGDGADQRLLEETGLDKADTFIAISNNDEANILSALLASQQGCPRVISLVNRPSYLSMLTGLGIDTVVTPRSITVANIIKHLRRGRIKEFHTLKEGFAEIIEAEVTENTKIVDLSVEQLSLPEEIMVSALWREGQMMVPNRETIFKKGDTVILTVCEGFVPIVEDLFSVVT